MNPNLAAARKAPRKKRAHTICTTRQAERCQEIQRRRPSQASLLMKSYERKVSWRMAVKCKCLECSDFNTEEAKNCKCELCPLWAYRPYQQ